MEKENISSDESEGIQGIFLNWVQLNALIQYYGEQTHVIDVVRDINSVPLDQRKDYISSIFGQKSESQSHENKI